jgi:hypothetical protein
VPTSFPLPLPNAPSGFATQAALDAAWTTPLNDLAASVAQSGFTNLTLASGIVASGLAPRVSSFGPLVILQGKVYPSGGGNFAINSSITICAAGGIPAAFRPASEVDKPVTGPSAATISRALVGADGSLLIGTSGTAASYFDISGLSGYLAGA